LSKAEKTRARADVPAILAALGVGAKGSDELTARCPSGTHKDATPSWSIHNEPGSEKHGLFHCHGCKWSGDVFDLVMHVRRCGFAEAAEFVRAHSTPGAAPGPAVDYGRPFAKVYPPEIHRPKGLRDVEPGSACAEYLESRGVLPFDVELFGLRDWRWRGRVWVPITRNRVLIAWTARTYRGEEPAKLTPLDGTLGYEWGLFGLDQAVRGVGELHLTEGWTSCIRVRQAGFRNPIAICGSTMSEQQKRDLEWAREITVWREGDVAGAAMDASVRGWLGPGRTVRTVHLPKGKDPADFPPDVLVKLHEDRR